jgi:hypothetical protein
MITLQKLFFGHMTFQLNGNLVIPRSNCKTSHGPILKGNIKTITGVYILYTERYNENIIRSIEIESIITSITRS